jgi:F-type H+-transporting ATPase subunit epsilon
MADLTVSVVSADAELWTGEARQVVARTLIGQIGLLAGHQPVLGVLAEGEVRITTLDGDVIRVNAQDGFLSMQNDVVTVVAGAAELL